jgi:hypothetical protein
LFEPDYPPFSRGMVDRWVFGVRLGFGRLDAGDPLGKESVPGARERSAAN